MFRRDVMTCTFFGHSTAPENIESQLETAIINLIENHGVKNFYVGNNGSFDGLAARALSELSEEYGIKYTVVLEKIPGDNDTRLDKYYPNTMLAPGFEKALPRFRIIHRNRWMIKNSDYVITYITNPFGSGAARFAELAEKKGKKIIKLGNY